ncbi:MAG TPA: lipid A export permease/ATP-binding protein MsbA [Gammaproteobacteria bacterium]|nr:lipid A export permease/ATP-binding protein MsbA [Gammaproteobacteria bacterium]
MIAAFGSGAIGVYRRLLTYVRPHRRVVAGSLLAAILNSGADSVVPFLMRAVIAELEAGSRAGSLWIPLAIAVLFPVRGALDFLAVYGLSWVGRSVVMDLRRELFAHYLALPARYFDRQASGLLISKLTYNTEQVAEGISAAVIVLIRDSLTIAILIGVMLYMSPTLTLLVAVVAPVVGLVVARVGKRLRRYGTRIQASMGEFTRAVQQSLSGHRIVKIFEGQERAREEFAEVNDRNARLQLKLTAVRSLGETVTQLAVALGIATVVFAAFSDTAFARLGAPQFIGFLGAMGMLLAPLRRITNVNATVQRAIAGAESIFETLDEPGESETGGVPVARAQGRVEYRGVSFSYEGSEHEALAGIDLAIAPGAHVAFVGRSGSGKSTLVSLLARFYDADEGAILLDGRDIREYRRRDLRRQLALVSQDVVLFDDSIANNIAYGALSSKSRAEIERAAEAAYVAEFAAELPDGLDTRVGERGLLLSGGQRQRIAIARALLKDAPVLILDEATSALDTDSERRIQAALAALMRGRTTLVVAHRLSTIESADVIVAMKDGRIVEAGTHEELMRRGGYYAALQRAQLAA